MMTDGNGETTCLFIVRLNNLRQIRAAFGEEAGHHAMDGLASRIGPHFQAVESLRTGHDDIEIVVREAGSAPPQPMGTMVDALCSLLAAEPVLYGDGALLLSLSAGGAVVGGSGDAPDALEEARAAARRQLAASSIRPDHSAERGEGWAKLFRRDMAIGAALLDQFTHGATFFGWRAVRKADDISFAFHHETCLCRMGEGGQRIDCGEGHQALTRLGLTYPVEHRIVSRVLDELERDPFACLSVPVSAQSLSFHLHGQDSSWTELRRRLARDRALAGRLIIEIDESSALASLDDAQEFVAAVRALGARIALGRFGSGFASIGQLLTLTADIVKLDSAFLRTAFQSDRHRARLSHLLGLARTIGPMVIVDGVDSALFLQLALEEGAEWVAGNHVGDVSLTRRWEQELQEETVISFSNFKAGLGRAPQAGESPQRAAGGH